MMLCCWDVVSYCVLVHGNKLLAWCDIIAATYCTAAMCGCYIASACCHAADVWCCTTSAPTDLVLCGCYACAYGLCCWHDVVLLVHGVPDVGMVLCWCHKGAWCHTSAVRCLCCCCCCLCCCIGMVFNAAGMLVWHIGEGVQGQVKANDKATRG